MLPIDCYDLMEVSTPLGKRNSITAKATGLIFSLFDIALPQDVPFGIPQYIIMDLPLSSFMFHFFMLDFRDAHCFSFVMAESEA